MRHTRSITGMLALAIGLAACGEAGPLTQGESQVSGDELSALLGGAGGDPRNGTAGGGVPVFDRLASQIPGFGGLYRTERCTVVIVLTDAGDAQQAIHAVETLVGPLVRRSCPQGLSLSVAHGHFTYIDLQRFLAIAQPLVQADDVFGMHIDYAANSLVIVVATAEVARRVGIVLASAGVPEAALTFRIRGGARPPGR